jgi:hypothetical protein
VKDVVDLIPERTLSARALVSTESIIIYIWVKIKIIFGPKFILMYFFAWYLTSSSNRNIATPFLEIQLLFVWLDLTQCINWLCGLFLITVQFFYLLTDNNIALLCWHQYVNIVLPRWTFENTFHPTQSTILKSVGIFVSL